MLSELELNKISYTIRDTGCNSNFFGCCEICQKTVAQVFHQIKWKEIFIKSVGRVVKNQMSDGYGHYQCLISKRVVPVEIIKQDGNG